jgi:hypothetical protein
MTNDQSPANAQSLEAVQKLDTAKRKRIPLSVARQRLQVDVTLEGYVLYWPLETQVHEFLQAGYEFVTSREVTVNNRDNPAADTLQGGNSAMDDKVRVFAGLIEGKPYYHILMKLPLEYYREDQRALLERNARMLEGIFRKEQILDSESLKVSEEDKSLRYVDTQRTSISRSLFQRPTRKSVT